MALQLYHIVDRFQDTRSIDEVDLEAWPGLLTVEVSAPEDWSGSVDMDPEDYVGRSPSEMPPGFHDPLEFLEEKQ